jgi:hypothetical protein
VRLVGPFPFIAGGKIRVGCHRTNGGPTLVFFDDAASSLDEVSIKIPTADEHVIRAYEEAVRAFNLKLATSLAKEVA